MMLHLVNYNARNTSSIKSVDVKCQLPPGKSLKEARLISPDSSSPELIKATEQKSTVNLTLPEFKTYAVLVLSW